MHPDDMYFYFSQDKCGTKGNKWIMENITSSNQFGGAKLIVWPGCQRVDECLMVCSARSASG